MTAKECEDKAVEYAEAVDQTSAMDRSVTKQTLAQLSTTYAILAVSVGLRDHAANATYSKDF